MLWDYFQITAFIIVPQTPVLTGVSVGIIVVCFAFFYMLTLLGRRLMETIEDVKEDLTTQDHQQEVTLHSGEEGRKGRGDLTGGHMGTSYITGKKSVVSKLHSFTISLL